jgi:ParB-like chromosome segregation protein Spo0J
MATLDIVIVAHSSIEPNDWNPNKQNERAFAAEKESILDHGFIVPVTVRPHPSKKDKYQIIDGYHRWLAIGEIIEKQTQGAGNLSEIIASKNIPVIILDADDATAKRLTVILNETRGRADMGELAVLLGDIQTDLGDDLIRGLPYSEGQLKELLSLSEFDWANLELTELTEPEEGDDEHSAKIVALLSANAEVLWKEALIQNAGNLPKDQKQAAGKLIEILLTQ